jgi:hypothetical protein
MDRFAAIARIQKFRTVEKLSQGARSEAKTRVAEPEIQFSVGS